MRHLERSFLATLVAAAAVGHAAVSAQTIPSPYDFIEKRNELGVYAGLVTAEKGRFDLGPDGGTSFGARYGIELSGPLSLEGHLGFVSGTRAIVNPARLEGDQIIGKADVLLTQIDGRLRFSFVGRRTWHSLSPFISFGGGVVFDVADTPVEEVEVLDPADVFDFGVSFYGTAGLGTRWFLTDTFVLRLDGTFSLWQIDTPPGFSDPDRGLENVEESEWMSGLEVAVSLLYRW
jgi:hypothetical protein